MRACAGGAAGRAQRRTRASRPRRGRARPALASRCVDLARAYASCCRLPESQAAREGGGLAVSKCGRRCGEGWTWTSRRRPLPFPRSASPHQRRRVCSTPAVPRDAQLTLCPARQPALRPDRRLSPRRRQTLPLSTSTLSPLAAPPGLRHNPPVRHLRSHKSGRDADLRQECVRPLSSDPLRTSAHLS